MSMTDNSPQIFILGAQRSGTTEMANLMMQVLGYAGDVESHLWPSVDAAWRSLDSALERIGGKNVPAYPHFTIGKVGLEEVKAAFATTLSDIYTARFGSAWIDKTPGPEMVEAVPCIATFFPKAKFIFMRRRGIENVLSKQRRFPKRPFLECCNEWSETMSTWWCQRSRIAGRYIEIEQAAMSHVPEETAANLGAFLGFDDQMTRSVAEFFQKTRSEQTQADTGNRTTSLIDTGWTEAQKEAFIKNCAATMIIYGYRFE
jgi:Sulfotransferase family